MPDNDIETKQEPTEDSEHQQKGKKEQQAEKRKGHDRRKFSFGYEGRERRGGFDRRDKA